MGKMGFSKLKWDIPHRVQLGISVQCNWTEGTYWNIWTGILITPDRDCPMEIPKRSMKSVLDVNHSTVLYKDKEFSHVLFCFLHCYIINHTKTLFCFLSCWDNRCETCSIHVLQGPTCSYSTYISTFSELIWTSFAWAIQTCSNNKSLQ